jgi:eukaryotic-like serine/threonine-protein kinase
VIDQKFSHYRVVEQIGSGGMGVVFRAHDEELDRDVALKVLRPGTIADRAARSRFRKEALALAKLDHPNIATIFEFGSQEGVDFLVTAYVPGLTLDAKLAAGALPPAEVVNLGIQLAKGLAAAHEKGIVHRDLKPGNLRLTPDGLLKVLDFGLAQFVETGPDAATIALTHSTELSGTLPYMSPEQVRAEPVDARTDIWAAGAVLYEMAAGTRPFRQKQTAALLNEILNTHPKSPRALNPQVSVGLETIIQHALAKDPARRYQTASELGADLERLQLGLSPSVRSETTVKWPILATVAVLVLLTAVAGFLLWRRQTPPSSNVRRSVAVLGLRNLSKNAADAWISPALSEMLTAELGAGGKLRTIPGENVARLKMDFPLPDSDSLAAETLAKIHRILGSDVVVTGSYLSLDGQIRIDLRVQDFSGERVATVSDQGSQAQFFELVKRLGDKLRQECGSGQLMQQELEATRAAEPANTEAVRFYTEGLEKLRQFDALAARDLLQRAVLADPNYALAHSALAAAWTQLGYDQNAIEESKKALHLSGQLPRADKLSIEARHYESIHNWDKAVEIYRSLWTFFSDDLDFGLRLATAQISAGRGQDALATVQSLRQLTAPSRDDPRIDLAEATAAGSLADFKHEQAAIAQAREKATRQGAQFTMAQALMEECWTLRSLGELEAAKTAGEQARSILSSAKDGRGEARSLTCVANVLADQGNLAEAEGMHERALALARKIGAQKDIAGALINLGNISAQRDLRESTARYQEALVVANAVGDKVDSLSAQNNIAANFIVEGQFPAATTILQSALRSANDLGDQSSEVVAKINLGNIYLALGKFADSRKYLAEALSQSKQLDLKSNIAAALMGLGDLALSEDDLGSAEQNYQQSLALRTQIGEQAGVANSQVSIATLDLERGNPKPAGDLARKAIDEFHNEHNDDLEAMARAVLLRALLAQADMAAAQNEYANIGKLAVQDKSLQITLGTAEARFIGATGSKDAAIRRLTDLAERARQLTLPSSEYDAHLARLELEMNDGIPTAREQLKRIQKDAEAGGFLLVARKAKALLNAAAH